jgi:23S rRNA pseudouridine2605 synthase
MLERLQKTLAAAGIGSRRACEAWILEGRVKVNGQVITELGTKVDLVTDRVTFNGRPVQLPRKRYYIALNKPRGVMSSLQDSHAARLVTDLVDLGDKPMLRPVGRLDVDSEGLIFLTDDGEFLYRLTHPRYHVPKTYRADVRGILTQESLDILRRGINLEDGPTQPAQNVRLCRSHKGDGKGEGADGVGQSEVELTIFEGRNRQVRRMFAALGHPVTKLTRIRIGDVRLTGLASGAWRHLTPGEVAALTVDSIPADSPTFTQNQTQEKSSWPVPPLSTPRREQSSSPLRKTMPPSRPRTSSNSPRRGSTPG